MAPSCDDQPESTRERECVSGCFCCGQLNGQPADIQIGSGDCIGRNCEEVCLELFGAVVGDCASQPKKPDGNPCDASTQCLSGFCAPAGGTNKVCCHQRCNGVCERCDIPATLGTCITLSPDECGSGGAAGSGG